MSGKERFYNFIVAFGSGFAFAGYGLLMVYRLWMPAIALFIASAFLAHAYRCKLLSDGYQSEAGRDAEAGGDY